MQKKVNDFSVKSGSKNIRGLGILPYGNLFRSVGRLNVKNFACVMTWAVLAAFVLNSVQNWLYRKNSYTEFFARAQFIKDFLSRIRYNFSKPGSVSDAKMLRIPLIFGITFFLLDNKGNCMPNQLFYVSF